MFKVVLWNVCWRIFETVRSLKFLCVPFFGSSSNMHLQCNKCRQNERMSRWTHFPPLQKKQMPVPVQYFSYKRPSDDKRSLVAKQKKQYLKLKVLRKLQSRLQVNKTVNVSSDACIWKEPVVANSRQKCVIERSEPTKPVVLKTLHALVNVVHFGLRINDTIVHTREVELLYKLPSTKIVKL